MPSADPGNPAGLASGTIEIKYTLLGDAQPRRSRQRHRLRHFGRKLQQGGPPRHSGWDEGDFNTTVRSTAPTFAEFGGEFQQGASLAAVSSDDTSAWNGVCIGTDFWPTAGPASSA